MVPRKYCTSCQSKQTLISTVIPKKGMKSKLNCPNALACNDSALGQCAQLDSLSIIQQRLLQSTVNQLKGEIWQDIQSLIRFHFGCLLGTDLAFDIGGYMKPFLKFKIYLPRVRQFPLSRRKSIKIEVCEVPLK